MTPPTSRRLGDVLTDIEKWEGQLREYYQCGGAVIPDGTKVLIVMGMLPANTNSSIRLALKGINVFASFQDTLRDNARFLEEHGGSAGPAHLLQDSFGNAYPHIGPEESQHDDAGGTSGLPIDPAAEEIDLDALIAQAVNMSREGHNDESVLAAARGYVRGNSGRFNGQGRPPPRGAQPRRFGPPTPRVATPPREPKDNKCANCNQPGHTKLDCPKPPISIEDRKCHICGKAGHIARKCPDKDKGGRPQAKPALMAQLGAGTAIYPYRNRTFLGVVTDKDGYQQPRRPRPKGVAFGELPITHREASQRLRKTSKFTPLIDYDDDDDYDVSYPQLTSLHTSAGSSYDISISATPASQPSSSVPNPISRKKKEKRYAHDFKKAIEESNRLNRSEMSHPSGGSSIDTAVTAPIDTSVSTPPPSANSDDPTPIHQDGSTGEVTQRIDPDTIEQPTSGEVPTTRLRFIAFEPHN